MGATKWEKLALSNALVDNWLDILRQYYVARGMSGDKLALKAGVGRSTVFLALAGKSVSKDKLEKIAKALDFNAESLFKDEFRKPLT